MMTSIKSKKQENIVMRYGEWFVCINYHQHMLHMQFWFTFQVASKHTWDSILGYSISMQVPP